MTRINLIPPNQLTRQHLIAEYRELPRVFKLAVNWFNRGGGDLPPTYRLGTGHMKFFYDKLEFLHDRQVSLVVEMKARGYTPKHDCPADLLRGIPSELIGGYEPTAEAIAASRARIQERLTHKKTSTEEK